jgi:hypothetical protein
LSAQRGDSPVKLGLNLAALRRRDVFSLYF